MSNQKGLFISLKAYEDQLPPDGTWSIRLTHSSRHMFSVLRAWITKSNICETNFETLENEKQLKTVSAMAFGKSIISVGSFEISNNDELKETSYSGLCQRKGAAVETKPDVLTFGKVSMTVPEHHNPFIRNGTSISSALITRLIAYIWESNPTLESRALKKVLQEKAVNLSKYEFQWVGLSQFRLEKAGAIISPLINKSRRRK